MTSTPFKLNYPKDHQEFERSMSVLVACHFNDDLSQINGRSGQKQNGVDIICYKYGNSENVVGIQCKHTDKILTESILCEEVEKAKTFKPILKTFIIATSSPRDVKVQEKARLLTQTLQTSNTPFTIHIWFWDDIEQNASKHTDAINAFDSTHNSFAAQTDTKMDKVLAILTEKKQNIALDDEKNTELNGQITAYCKDVENKSRVVIEENITHLKELKNRKWLEATQLEKYRLLTALAKCHEILGEFYASRKLIEDAHNEYPSHPNAKTNLAGLLILQDRHDEANKIAEKILSNDPKNEEAAGLLIHSKIKDQLCGNPLNLINPDIINSLSVQINYVFFLRYRNENSWVEAAKNAFHKFSDNLTLKQFYYEGVLSSFVTNNMDYVLGAYVEKDLVEEFTKAILFLKEETLKIIEKQTHLCDSLACNAVLGIDYLFQDYETAKTILDYAEKCNPKSIDIEHHMIMVLISSNNNYDFSLFLTKETTDKKFVFLKFQILMQQMRFEEAKAKAEILAMDYSDLKIINIYSLIQNKDLDEAKILLLELISELPINVKLSRRFELAKIAEQLSLFQEVVDLLAGHVDLSRQSESLNILAFVAFSHKLPYAEELINELSQEVLRKKYYHQLKVGYLYNIQCPTSIAEMENYLSIYPEDFDIRFRWWGLLKGYNQSDKIRKDLDIILSDRYETKEFELHIAQYLVNWLMKYDFVSEALSLGYKTLLNNWQKIEAHQLYFVLFFHSGLNKLDEVIFTSDTVQEGFSITVQSEQGDLQKFRFERNNYFHFSSERKNPNDEMWEMLYGKQLNSTFEFGNFQKRMYKIIEIKNVYIDALHESKLYAEMNFPNQKYFQSFKMDMTKEDPIEDLINFMKEHNKQSQVQYQQFQDLYYVKHLPLHFCSKLLNEDVIEAYERLVLMRKEIRVSLGSMQEFLQAEKSLHEFKGKNCILDALTLYLIRKYKLLPVLKSFFNTIYAPQSAIMLFHERMDKLEQSTNKEQVVSFGDGENIGLDTFTSDDNNRRFIAANETYLWVLENIKSISLLPMEAIHRFEYLKNGETDSILAAQSHNHLLISEDYSFRMIASEVNNVQSVWLQPILLMALGSDVISQEFYNKTIVEMALQNHTFISLDAECLFYQAEEDDFNVSESLKSLLNIVISNIAPNGVANYQNLGVIVAFINKLIYFKIDDFLIKMIINEIYNLLKKHDKFYKYSISIIARKFLDKRFIPHTEAWYFLNK